MKQVISGVLLLDKASGISSHSALARAKFLFKSDSQDSKKAGHTGTLDPMATGLLPLCFGEATKFAQFGLDADKGYQALIKLGAQTDSGDADGQIVQSAPIVPFCQETLDALAKTLIGEQQQVPPMYSALKKDGKKLYEYARAGVEVARQPRTIYIHHLSLSKISDDEILLNVRCSKGTYVRVLGETIAEKLGTLGHLTALRRTQTGGFDVADAIDLAQLEQRSMDERLASLLPIDVLLGHLPRLDVTDAQCARLQLGQRLNVKSQLTHLPTFTDPLMVRIYDGDAFAGLGEVEPNGRLQPKKMLTR